MRIVIYLALLFFEFSYGKEIKITWDENPVEEKVSLYYVYTSDNTETVTEHNNITLNVSDVYTTRIWVIAYNGKFSSTSDSVKYTPGRETVVETGLGINPSTNNQAMKFVISHDVGREIKIEESVDLINWEVCDTIVIGDGDTYIGYFDVDNNKKFFRFNK